MDESPGKMYALAVVLMAIPLAAVPLRFYVRRVNNTKLGWDDWFMLPALVSISYFNKLFFGSWKIALHIAHWDCDDNWSIDTRASASTADRV